MNEHETLCRECIMAPSKPIGSMYFWLTRNIDRSSRVIWTISPIKGSCNTEGRHCTLQCEFDLHDGLVRVVLAC